MRRLSSILRRRVVTVDGRELGRCYDVRGELTASSLRVTGLVVGRQGLLEHFGIGRLWHRRGRGTEAIPWSAVVRIEGERIVVRDETRS